MRLSAAALAFAAVLAPVAGLAAGTPTFQIAIKNHGFKPHTTRIPSGVRVKLRVTNTRKLPSEFESFDLNREKIAPPGATITVWVGPLSAGKYRIFDDFNPGTTGWIVAAPPGQGGAK